MSEVPRPLAQTTRTRIAFEGSGKKRPFLPVLRKDLGVGGGDCFGGEEDGAAAQSLEAPHRKTLSASTNLTTSSAKTTTRNRITHRQTFTPEMD
ncbi:hypothetical protein F2Q70_00006871 [Brassica cretica]|uniref:Uncharacterized protein n=1 Tax=Brassica cretica TaxID=69181 RepID=A0A8S9IMW1_BRACR|nr:hypothetical protein F2Q68_00023543 [Brassica cretica]KAF2570713.1 hypothetical protein F2Q70_00006871 [Brassica cretica]